MGKIARLAALGAGLPLLAGCFDVTQTLTVEADGTATLVLEIAMDSSMMAFMEMTPDDFCPADDPVEDVPEGFTAEMVRSQEGINLVCRITVVGPVDSLPTVLEQGSLLPMSDEGGEITLVGEGDGVYTYTVLLAPPEDAADLTGPPAASPEEAQMQEALMASIMQSFAGRLFSMSVTAPDILESTGTISDSPGGETATWELPMQDFMFPPEGDEPAAEGEEGEVFAYEFRTRFDLTP